MVRRLAGDLLKGELSVVVVGLGYVGLPLAAAFHRSLPTIGFDASARRIEELRAGRDRTGQVDSSSLEGMKLSDDPGCIAEAGVVVIAVPTPVDNAHRPDLTVLLDATRTVGLHLAEGATVIYESTVYPGCTEGDCVPVLEEASGLRYGEGFFVGYSPERINPGDRVHTLESVIKVVSASDEQTLEQVAALYERVVDAGVHRAANIATAEAAKVIENTQRDLNIALVNELALIFQRMGIDTLDVLEAAGTKWNFLPFRPGLVGGHCIGVDPYYLTHRAEQLGYHPEVVLAGRRINDSMGYYVADRTVRELVARGGRPVSSRALVLGLTFKEDCSDLRNTRVVDLVERLSSWGLEVDVHDPVADPKEAREECGVELVEPSGRYHVVVLAVAHAGFRQAGVAGMADLLEPDGVVGDIKGLLDREAAEAAGICLWRL